MASVASEPTRYQVGVDIGGTFTDVVVCDEQGQVYRQKAFTTHDDYPQGILDGLRKVTEYDIGIQLPDLLSRTKVFINGTTIVTNSLAEMKGLRVGLITTAGFRDTLRIARSARTNDWNMQTQVPPPELVARDCITEVNERVDYAGRVVVALDREQARRAIRHLVEDRKVEALGVCLLWSFRNPDHEQAIKAMVNEMYPDLFVSISSNVYPVAREYERMVTTCLNCFTARGTDKYLGSLEGRLKDYGLRVPVGLMQSIGGVTSTAEARQNPIRLLNSGPVGGVVAANNLGKTMGIRNIICADMGGTSFDTALIKDNQIMHIHRATINRLSTGLSMVDIQSIGAGGGSLAWIDARNAPRVGPQSAGSMPGPVCYGRGGTQPTTTDVSVALGLIDPDYFLGGEVKLDREAANGTLEETVARPLGVSLLEAADGLYQLVVANMSHAVRSVTIEKGNDPREFTIISYGGASGVFIADIARELDIRQVIIPATAAVFSAYGLLWSDYRRTYVKTVNWNLAKGEMGPVNAVFNELVRQGISDLAANGFSTGDITVIREGDFKFGTQAFELTIPVPDRPLSNVDRPGLMKTFQQVYENLYGEGTSWEGADHLTVMLNCRVTVVGKTAKPAIQTRDLGPSDPEAARRGEREVFLPRVREKWSLPVYQDAGLRPGMIIPGPAIVEAPDTTVFLPRDATLRVDEYRNYVLNV